MRDDDVADLMAKAMAEKEQVRKSIELCSRYLLYERVKALRKRYDTLEAVIAWLDEQSEDPNGVTHAYNPLEPTRD